MDCCNKNMNSGQKDKHTHKGHISHIWMMALCCGAPLILLLAASLLGTSLPGVRAVMLSILPYICPVMMIAMILMMFIHGKHDHDGCVEKQEQPRISEDSSNNHQLN